MLSCSRLRQGDAVVSADATDAEGVVEDRRYSATAGGIPATKVMMKCQPAIRPVCAHGGP